MADVWAFIVMAAVMEITPGPNMGYLAVLSLSQGRRAGLAAVAGVALGLAVIGVLAAIGLAAVVSASAVAYEALRWGGIGYLLWLAWDGWRGADGEAAPEDRGGRYFMRGLVTNLLNPKAFLFYVSVLPNFISPAAAGSAGVAIGLTAIYVAVATVVHCVIVGVASSMRRFLQDPARVRFVRRALAMLMVLIAVWIFFETRI